LVVQPNLRKENGERSEQDRKADHDESAGPHRDPLRTRKILCA
jgi:hypothetical protein